MMKKLGILVLSHTVISRMILITIATLFNTIVTVSLMAEGLPNGETVVSGVISISQNEQSMTIDQSSNQAIIEWNSFDIGQNNSVTFQQPSISSSALNRVMSGNPTTLAGTLNANGNVYVVNENGVYFTSTSSITANSGREILMIGSWMFNIVSAEWVIRKIYFNRSAV